MKHFLFFLCFFIACQSIQSQQLSIDITAMKNADFSTISVYDPAKYGGRSSKSLSYEDIEGTPFLDEHWNKGMVIAKNGQTHMFQQIRINLYSHEMHYLDSTGLELSIDGDRIQTIYSFNKKDSTQLAEVYVALPDFVDSKPFALYRVFNNGTYQLLRLQKRYVQTDPYDPRLAKTISRFYQKTFYAFYHLGRILPLKSLSQTDFEKVIPLDANSSTWLSQHKNKLRSEHDVVDFLTYFNAVKQ